MRPQQRCKSTLRFEIIALFHSQIWNDINRQREEGWTIFRCTERVVNDSRTQWEKDK